MYSRSPDNPTLLVTEASVERPFSAAPKGRIPCRMILCRELLHGRLFLSLGRRVMGYARSRRASYILTPPVSDRNDYS